MKISNRTIIESIPIIRGIMQKQLPVKVSYCIRKNTIKLDSELQIYDQERNQLLSKYAVKDKNGKTEMDSDGISIKFNSENDKTVFQEEMSQLLEIENEIEFKTFRLEEMGGSLFSPAEVAAIEYMIEEQQGG